MRAQAQCSKDFSVSYRKVFFFFYRTQTWIIPTGNFRIYFFLLLPFARSFTFFISVNEGEKEKKPILLTDREIEREVELRFSNFVWDVIKLLWCVQSKQQCKTRPYKMIAHIHSYTQTHSHSNIFHAILNGRSLSFVTRMFSCIWWRGSKERQNIRITIMWRSFMI